MNSGYRFQLPFSSTNATSTAESGSELNSRDCARNHFTSSDGHTSASVEIADEANFDVNLRSSCIECCFLSECPVAGKKGTPKLDVLLGTYRIRALKKRCLV